MITAATSLGMYFFDIEHDKCLDNLQQMKDRCKEFAGQEYPQAEPEHTSWWRSMCGYDNPKWVVVHAEDNDIRREHKSAWFLNAPQINVLTEPTDNLDDAVAMLEELRRNQNGN